MFNRVTLIGRVGSDPEVRTSTKETKFARLSIATNEKFKVKEEWKEKTQWHRIVVWDSGITATIEKYVKKGSLLFIEGQIETRSYEDKGVTKYITEVVVHRVRGIMRMLDSKGGDIGKVDNPTKEKGGVDISEEDIPF